MDRVIVLRRPSGARNLQRELVDLFRQQLNRPVAVSMHQADGVWTPESDVYELADSYVVLVELAGMRHGTVEVTLAENALIIVGRRPELHRAGTLRFHQLEIQEGPFQLAVLLPGPVDDDQVTAGYDDGLLTITLPKRTPQGRKIAITQE